MGLLQKIFRKKNYVIIKQEFNYPRVYVVIYADTTVEARQRAITAGLDSSYILGVYHKISEIPESDCGINYRERLGPYRDPSEKLSPIEENEIPSYFWKTEGFNEKNGSSEKKKSRLTIVPPKEEKTILISPVRRFGLLKEKIKISNIIGIKKISTLKSSAMTELDNVYKNPVFSKKIYEEYIECGINLYILITKQKKFIIGENDKITTEQNTMFRA